jgi:hypothetical protein
MVVVVCGGDNIDSFPTNQISPNQTVEILLMWVTKAYPDKWPIDFTSVLV